MALVVIDPGHGGTQEIGGSSPNNAVGPGGAKEKDLTLKVALGLRSRLAGRSHTVILTREGDENLGLRERANVAREANADVFISIHFNANDPTQAAKAQGTETWVYPGTGNGESSRVLASKLQREVVRATALRDRGTKDTQRLAVLNPKYHSPKTAACLCEVSFLDDAEEERRLISSDAYLASIEEAFVRGVAEFVAERQLMEELSTTTQPELRATIDSANRAAIEFLAQGIQQVRVGAAEIGDPLRRVPLFFPNGIELVKVVLAFGPRETPTYSVEFLAAGGKELSPRAHSTRVHEHLEESLDALEPLLDAKTLALREALRARSRIYFDAAADRVDVGRYYGNWIPGREARLNYNHLAELLELTHKPRPTYQPMTEVYPWIDTHDIDGKLVIKSIYSGKQYEVREFIERDARIDERRETLLAALAPGEGEENLATALLELLDAQLPYNCEHVVPQSWFDKQEPMRGDLHHLFACESGCNSFRGNTPYFDFEELERVVRNECGKREINKFEPEAGKGAVSRAVLYFLLRYPGKIRSATNEYMPDRIKLLLDWHKKYNVDTYEKHRNQSIFARQGNRNPLIDFPEWADSIDWLAGLGTLS